MTVACRAAAARLSRDPRRRYNFVQAITPEHPLGTDADLLAREPPPNRGVLKRSLAWCRRQSVAADRLSPALSDPAWQVPTLAAMFKGRRAWELEPMQEI